MKNPWEERLHYALLALFVLAVFYGIYFGKMLVQKRHGIRTHQIGRRKEKGLHTVETLMSIATLGVPIAQLVSIAFEWNHLPSGARFTGFLVGLLGDGIFLLSVLCMKDSWRAGIPDKDKTELVTTGIYRFSRNPAFLGFDFMYIGILLMYGNLLTLGFPCLLSPCSTCRYCRRSYILQIPLELRIRNIADMYYAIWEENERLFKRNYETR